MPHSLPPNSLTAIGAAWETIIRELGYDPNDPHLTGSPERVARFLAEWHTKAGVAPPTLTTFPNEPKVDELVACGGISFYSVCAHHGLPFYGQAAIGYIPGKSVLGLSKFARVVHHFANRFQVQERLTNDIAKYLEDELEPIGIGVVLSAEHMCMSMRGVRSGGHTTVTSDMRGAFRSKPEARAELMSLIGRRGQ